MCRFQAAHYILCGTKTYVLWLSTMTKFGKHRTNRVRAQNDTAILHLVGMHVSLRRISFTTVTVYHWRDVFHKMSESQFQCNLRLHNMGAAHQQQRRPVPDSYCYSTLSQGGDIDKPRSVENQPTTSTRTSSVLLHTGHTPTLYKKICRQNNIVKGRRTSVSLFAILVETGGNKPTDKTGAV